MGIIYRDPEDSYYDEAEFAIVKGNTVFGNLMDNAMTAAEKSSEKRLTLETGWRNNYSVAVIRNSCDTRPKTNKGRLVTTKPDSRLHGYGLKSVANTLKNTMEPRTGIMMKRSMNL